MASQVTVATETTTAAATHKLKGRSLSGRHSRAARAMVTGKASLRLKLPGTHSTFQVFRWPARWGIHHRLLIRGLTAVHSHATTGGKPPRTHQTLYSPSLEMSRQAAFRNTLVPCPITSPAERTTASYTLHPRVLREVWRVKRSVKNITPPSLPIPCKTVPLSCRDSEAIKIRGDYIPPTATGATCRASRRQTSK